MKIFSKLTKLAATLTLLSIIAFGGVGHVVAAGSGQIIPAYEAENLTQKTGFANPTTATACDELEYRARLWNPGPGVLNNVMVQISLSSAVVTTNTSTISATSNDADPVSASAQTTVNLSPAESINYEAGTAQLLDSNTNFVKSLPDSIMDYQGGVNIGTLGESQLEFVQFKAKVSCPQITIPTYACTELGLAAELNRTVKVSSFSTTQTNGAVFKNAVINWGDNSVQLTTANAVGQTHQYAADGTYTVSATARFTVNGRDVTADGPQCQQQVTFSSTTPPTVTPPPSTPPAATPAAPTALVNTGPGSVVGMFAAATAVGTFIYRRYLTRRLSRQ